jgi:hypothetical protein
MDRLRSRAEVAERVEDDLRRQLIAAERALVEAREAIRLIRTRHGECSCLGCQEGMRVLAAASPGPNNAEKEGAGWGEDEGEREP